MDPRCLAAKSILIFGSLLTILGLGTVALVTGSTLTFLLPALAGIVLLLTGCLVLKAREWHRFLLGFATLIALTTLALTLPGIVEALRSPVLMPLSPLHVQQSIAVLLCTIFVALSIRRLTAPQMA